MIYLIILSFILLIIDWAQTTTIARHPEKWHENHFPDGIADIIGEHPTQSTVNLWFGAWALIIGAGLAFLPDWARVVMLIVVIGLEARVVYRNFKAGIYPLD